MGVLSEILYKSISEEVLPILDYGCNGVVAIGDRHHCGYESGLLPLLVNVKACRDNCLLRNKRAKRVLLLKFVYWK